MVEKRSMHWTLYTTPYRVQPWSLVRYISEAHRMTFEVAKRQSIRGTGPRQNHIHPLTMIRRRSLPIPCLPLVQPNRVGFQELNHMNTARLLPCGTLTSAPNVWFERLAEICLQLVIYLCARKAIIDLREKRVSHNTINSLGGVKKEKKKKEKEKEKVPGFLWIQV